MWSCLVLASSIALGPAAPPKPAIGLDPGWLGHWKGELAVQVKDRPPTVNMELVIAPLADGSGWEWTIIYGEGESRQVRAYVLLPGDRPGRYVMDERNGILLDMAFEQGALVSAFEVEGSLLVSREALAGDTIAYRIDTFAAAEPRSSSVGDPKKPTVVKSYRPLGTQAATLRRVPAGTPAHQ